ncbi:hypothetical protein [Pseudomonas haemolytica]|uniref:Uncharacterized protein n=1 Tax=Pseudomonas haemolytica TaxID=2600065 RepID=A0A5P1DDA7_9PSED|nr:hypothetical protein [Pseudomonas haemolytica]MRJ38495.1 hypothetical protein [Pseudomonas haemolytica]
MTTNVICRTKKLLTSDSRWSCSIVGYPDHIAFVDNTGFDKLAVRQAHALVFAGDGELIAAWKAWFTAKSLDFGKMPGFHRLIPGTNILESIVISLVKKPSCDVMFSSGNFMAHGEEARFSGSGAQFAKDCYARNLCGRTAITTAGQSDPATGGETKFVELETGSTNLTVLQATLNELKNALNVRGFVMDTTTKTVTPINAWQPGSADAKRAIVSSVASISAPTGLPTRCWSDQEQNEFVKALREVEREEAAMQ